MGTNPVPIERRTTSEGWWAAPLFLAAFCLCLKLSFWFQDWPGNRASTGNLMAILMGDARKMFAQHFFIKADAYFHSGFYPTIYDNGQAFQTPHIAEDSGAMKGRNSGDENSFLGPPRNWIDRFGRQFFPSVHTHLSEGGANGKEDEGQVREILPWVKLSTEMDPQRVETYTVGAYWLRRIGKTAEAEDFLREGLRENPGDPQILYDLGRLYLAKGDSARARNIWESAIRRLPDVRETREHDARFVAQQLFGALAQLEEKEGHFSAALSLLNRLKDISPNPEAIETWIKRVRDTAAKMNTASPTSKKA